MKNRSYRLKLHSWAKVSLLTSVSFALAACQSTEPEEALTTKSLALTVQQRCVEPSESLNTKSVEAEQIRDGLWHCGETRVIDCDAAPEDITLVVERDDSSCVDGEEVTIYDDTIKHSDFEIDISDEKNGDSICRASIQVRDDNVPVASSELTLWSPNHKYAEIKPEDCVRAIDRCDADVDVFFTYVTSDEPENATGDGNTTEDIRNARCDGVELRRERAGNRDGRIYKIGYIAIDDAGNKTDGECIISVDHDRGNEGGAVDSGEAYRVDVEGVDACIANRLDNDTVTPEEEPIDVVETPQAPEETNEADENDMQVVETTPEVPAPELTPETNPKPDVVQLDEPAAPVTTVTHTFR